MVNQKAVDYIKQYKDTYSIDALKSNLTNQGYPPAEVEEAATIAMQAEPAPAAAPPQAEPVATPQFDQQQAPPQADQQAAPQFVEPAPQTAGAEMQPMPTAQPSDNSNQNRTLAALGYPIGIIALILIFIAKDDHWAKTHAFAGLFWNLAYVVISVFISFVTFFLPFSLSWLLWIAFLGLSIYFAYEVYNGKDVEIPLISKLARDAAK